MANDINKSQKATFSKDNPIVEVSSKQNQVQVKNVIPPVKQKESIQ